MTLVFPGVAAVKNSPEYQLLQGMMAIAGSVLDAPLNCSFQAPLARLPLKNPSWACARLALS